MALTDDKITTVDLVCELWLNQDFRITFELKRLAEELDVDPECNRFFYIVRKLPLRIQSRWYIFDRKSDTEGDNDNVPNVVNTDASSTCGVYIDEHSHLRSEEILTAISNLKQTITHLHYESWIPMENDAIKVPVLSEKLSSCDKQKHFHIPRMTHTALLLVSNLGTKTNLTHLDLNDCGLSEKLCITLCQQLQHLPCLKYLNLSENTIGSEGAEHLAESMTSWGPDPPLKQLNLSRCSIEGSGAEKLIKSLQFCRRLEEIHMDYNRIGSTGAKKLAASIISWGSDNALFRLSLEYCSIDTSGCIPLMEALTSCKHLYCVDVPNNRIGGTFEALNPHLDYTELCWLKASRTSLTEGDIQNIAAIINNKGLPELHTLDLGYVKLSDERLSGLTDEARYVAMLKNESDETLEAWRTIVQKVRFVRLWEGNVFIKVTEELVKQEEERRKNSFSILKVKLLSSIISLRSKSTQQHEQWTV